MRTDFNFDAAPQVLQVAHLTLTYRPFAWPFAEERRADIVAHFAESQVRSPGLWNGPVMLLNAWEVAGDTFRGTFFETDFASFLAWRDWGFPDPAVRNAFAMGALRGSDGAFLLGVMGSHTANAGRIYFPSGTPDPSDRTAIGTVDLAGSIAREVREETGLGPEDYRTEPEWHLVFDGGRIAFIRVLQSEQPAEGLRERLRGFLAREQEPELSDFWIARSPADYSERMPPFVTAFLDHTWGGRR